jgi:hydroxymethylglutaryl-CoA synthase
MGGIISYGAYIPLYRLDRAEIAKAWGIPGAPGEKAVANYDEDSITMSVAACLDCLGDVDRQQVDGLFLATTTSPFRERQAAAIVARAVDLRPDALTTDYANSLRGGTLALKAALDAVESGSLKQVLVVATDCRLGAAQGMREFILGDGAAALLVGKSNVIAKVADSRTVYSDIMDVWRAEGDRFVRSWEDRFAIDKGYTQTVVEAVAAVMKSCRLGPGDITKAALYNPDPRSHHGLARALGLDSTNQIQDTLFFSAGNTGTAQVVMMLVEVLEGAKAGDKILMASYGDGSDAFILEVTEGISKISGRRGIKGHAGIKKNLRNYEAYARIRQLIPIEPLPRPPKLIPSAVVQWRQSKQNLALYGSKCKRCGKPQYPVQRVCAYCSSVDDFEPYRFSDKKATLFTYSFDNLGFAVTDVPPVGGGVINFEGGGRILCQVTDCDQEEVQIGMPVEMAFRKLYQAEGIPAYCWKAKPAK